MRDDGGNPFCGNGVGRLISVKRNCHVTNKKQNKQTSKQTIN